MLLTTVIRRTLVSAFFGFEGSKSFPMPVAEVTVMWERWTSGRGKGWEEKKKETIERISGAKAKVLIPALPRTGYKSLEKLPYQTSPLSSEDTMEMIIALTF